MDEKQLDQLFEKKIRQAKAGRFLRFGLIALLCVAVLGSGIHLAANARRGPESEPPVETPSPAPTIALSETKAPVPSASPTTAAMTPTEAPTASTEPTQAPTASSQPTEAPKASAEPTQAPKASTEPTQAPKASSQPTEAPKASTQPAEAPTASAEPTKAPTETPAPSAEPESVAHVLQIVWTPEDSAPTGGVTVHVLHGGTELRTLRLNAQNKWTQRWSDSYGADELSLTADVPSGFAAETNTAGDDFKVVFVRSETPATASPTPQGSALPQTGPLFWPIPLLFVPGCGCLILSYKQARRVRR